MNNQAKERKKVESSLRRVTVVTPDGVEHHCVPYKILPTALKNYEEMFGGTFTLYCVQVPPETISDNGLSALEEFEAQVLREVLEFHCCDMNMTAQALGISRPTLKKKLDRYGIKFKTSVA